MEMMAYKCMRAHGDDGYAACMLTEMMAYKCTCAHGDDGYAGMRAYEMMDRHACTRM
jgi:hypothetical protein